MESPELLLERVTDRDSFIAFVTALAEERARAAEIERNNPQRYVLDGAHNWKNGEIDSFLYSALQYFEPGVFHQPEDIPSWKMFARFLYFGKIYE